MVIQVRELPMGLKQQVQERERARRKGRADEVTLQSVAHTARNDLAPLLKLEERRLADLKAAARRARRSEADQIERVMNAMKVLGYIVPIIINAKNQIIDGHIVAEAAGRLGLETVQCVVVEHLTPDEERLARVAINRLGELGVWDLEALALELSELQAERFELAVTGFDSGQLDLILGHVVDTALTSDSVPKVPKIPTSRSGDLWLLGDHRLICGDAREPDAYRRLLDGEKIDCVFSDPPYNIKIDGVVSGLGKVKHGDFAMGCGEMSDDGFRTFLSTYLARCRENCSEGAAIFACMDWRQVDLLLLAGRDAGLERINKVVWYKGAGGMGGLYRSAYEEIAVFCTAQSAATNNVQLGRHGRNRTNVWEYPGANRMGSSAKGALADHPTPKPVELVADALLDVTKRGAVVLDPFMGSGTTIMACEKEKRLGRGIEFDPAYVDVAIRRWQEATGKVAVHAESRLSFDQLADQRAAERDNAAGAEVRPPAENKGDSAHSSATAAAK